MPVQARTRPNQKTSARVIEPPFVVVEPPEGTDLDRLLDEALNDTFPASDPPSVVAPR